MNEGKVECGRVRQEGQRGGKGQGAGVGRVPGGCGEALTPRFPSEVHRSQLNDDAS